MPPGASPRAPTALTGDKRGSTHTILRWAKIALERIRYSCAYEVRRQTRRQSAGGRRPGESRRVRTGVCQFGGQLVGQLPVSLPPQALEGFAPHVLKAPVSDLGTCEREGFCPPRARFPPEASAALTKRASPDLASHNTCKVLACADRTDLTSGSRPSLSRGVFTGV
jgi:hypothetical protein